MDAVMGNGDAKRPHSRGQSTLFGFKPSPAPAAAASPAPQPASPATQAPRPNRFGFKPPVVAASNKVSDSAEASRFTLQTSLLPAPQYPVRLASKGAKTVANYSTRQQQVIETLTVSPGVANRRSKRQASMRRRELEVVLNGHSFDVCDVKDDQDGHVITEISVISLGKPALRVTPQLAAPVAAREVKPSFLPGPRDNRPTPVDTPRDNRTTHVDSPIERKTEQLDSPEDNKQAYIRSDPMDELECWGVGEAMADASEAQPRPAHLAIEEARFAAIAASESTLLDDERSPVDSLVSSEASTSDSSEKKPSSSEFLIDDEIADQPDLVFEDMQPEATESSPTLKLEPARRQLGSVGTLSPCESITSDDLMVDFDTSRTNLLADCGVSPPVVDGEDYMRIDRASYQQMCQDIVSMKTSLLKLKRMFHEAESVNPFDSSPSKLPSGLTLADSQPDLRSCGGDLDLRRQTVYLQQQVVERDRAILRLEARVARNDANATNATTTAAATCNAATQTERVRPVSAGPSLLHSLPTDGVNGPLVSLNDGWRPRKLSLGGRKVASPIPLRRTSLTATNIPTYKYQPNGTARKT